MEVAALDERHREVTAIASLADFWTDPAAHLAPPPTGPTVATASMPYWWLNEQASIYISGKDDPGKRRVFDRPGCACQQHRQPTSSR